ncbi:MAG TPA: hypothetical protein DEB25_06090 [Desulfobulbaceae bacterium]|nr:hypothetical protein [Desulfobulbaceae bacterium]
MNKRRIEQMIPLAITVLQEKELKILEDGIIKKAWRGQLAAFGATVATGSLLAATAFFAKQGNAEVDRAKLSKAIYEVMKKYQSEQGQDMRSADSLLHFVQCVLVTEPAHKQAMKEVVLDAATALKLAMNLFIAEEKDDKVASNQVVGHGGEGQV